MDEPRFIGEISLRYPGRAAPWMVVRETVDLLRAFVATQEPGHEWRWEFHAFADGDKVGRATTVAELREAWERHQLELEYFVAGASPATGSTGLRHVSLSLDRNRMVRDWPWEGHVAAQAVASVPVNTLLVDLARELTRALPTVIPGSTVGALEPPSAVRFPERVPVGAAATSAAPRASASTPKPSPEAAAATPTPQRPWITRVVRGARVHVVSAVLAATTVAMYAGVAHALHLWPL